MAAAPVVLIGAWFLLRQAPRTWPRLVLALAAGALVPVLLVASYHQAAFGAPWRTGYSFIVNPEFSAGQKSGLFGIKSFSVDALYGITFGRSRGLFYLAPVALIGVVLTLWRAVRQSDWAQRAGVAAFCLLVLLNSSYFVWWGGAAAGPRHLVGTLGGLGLGLAAVLRRRGLPRLAVLAVGALSIINMLVLTLVGIEAPEFQDPLLDFAYPNFFAGKTAVVDGATTLGRRLGLAPPVSLLVLILWCALGFWYVYGLTRSDRPARRRTLTSRTTPAL